MTAIIITSFIVIVAICTVALIRGATRPDDELLMTKETEDGYLFKFYTDRTEVSEPITGLPFPRVESESLPVGWQGWEGGDCPVPVNTMISVMFADAEIYSGLACEELRWSHQDNNGDIVAWRVAD